jgi:hypothetical protein
METRDAAGRFDHEGLSHEWCFSRGLVQHTRDEHPPRHAPHRPATAVHHTRDREATAPGLARVPAAPARAIGSRERPPS